MTVHELVAFQIEHSAWALGELIRHAQGLSPQQVEQDLGIGPGSVRANLAHTIEAMFFFADNFAGRDYVQPAEFARESRTLEGLARLLPKAAGALRTAMLDACRNGLAERVPWPSARGGSLTATAAVAQVFDHSTLHRTQCINMLKRLGVRPVPDLDPMTFLAAGLAAVDGGR